MNDQIRTAANNVATATDHLLAVASQGNVTPASLTVMDRLHALPDGKANGLIPMARVNTRNGIIKTAIRPLQKLSWGKWSPRREHWK